MIKELTNFFGNYGLAIVLTAVVAYLLGSVSFSILFTRKFDNHADIRTMGSGNAGFTNVLRSVGRLPAVFTLLGDFSKCIIAVLIGRLIFQYFSADVVASFAVMQYASYLAGFSCLMGHIYPCYFGFRGGKGVLTSIAMILILDWRIFLIVLATFLIVFFSSKIISLSSIIGAIIFPISTFLVTFFIDYRSEAAFAHGCTLSYVLITTAIATLIAAVVIMKHSANIKRILAGTEKKITSKK